MRSRLGNRQTSAGERPGEGAGPAVAVRQQNARTEARHEALGSRLAEHSPRGGPGPGTRDERRGPPASQMHPRYYDRPDLIRHDYRHTYSYYGHDYRLHYRVIWPNYYYPVCYGFGPYRTFCHVYPYYHRKYVFISLGGWWPTDYSYMRYYWYGWHPYEWYGYYPIAQEVAADNYNYYTYNYYNADGSSTSYVSETPIQTGRQAVDTSTWADVREKLDKQEAEPAAATLADTRFEGGVKSFEAGNYGEAAREFEQAMRLSPNDMILPFAYAQAMFADGRYTESAEILRMAISRVSPEKEGVFYPRGLYANDDVLYAQIEKLVEKLDQFGYDADMQLLLGYHLLGMGETGYAREPLEIAGQDLKNAESAKILLKLLDKVESEAKAADKATSAAVEVSNVAVESSAEAKTVVATEPNAVTPPADTQPSNISDVPEETVPDVPTQETPAGDKMDGAGTLVDPTSDHEASSQTPQSSDGPGVALASLPSDVIGGIGRYLRVDWGIFAGIVLLVWAGVYVQWRGLNSPDA
jgi:tetratricopeptide (TPR) repeat protein